MLDKTFLDKFKNQARCVFEVSREILKINAKS